MNTLTELFCAIRDFFTGLHKTKTVFNMAVNVYTVAQYVTVQRGCTGFMFTNVGNDTAFVNGMVIFPGTLNTILGDSRSIGAHKNDVYKGVIQLTFAGVGANPAVEIVQIFYADEQE